MEGEPSNVPQVNVSDPTVQNNSRCVYLENVFRYVTETLENKKLFPLFQDCEPRIDLYGVNHGKAICNIITHYKEDLDRLFNMIYNRIKTRDQIKFFLRRVEERSFIRGYSAENMFVYKSIAARFASRLFAIGVEDAPRIFIEIMVERQMIFQSRFDERFNQNTVNCIVDSLSEDISLVPVVTPMKVGMPSDYF